MNPSPGQSHDIKKLQVHTFKVKNKIDTAKKRVERKRESNPEALVLIYQQRKSNAPKG